MKEFIFRLKTCWGFYGETSDLWLSNLEDLWDAIKSGLSALWQLIGCVVMWTLFPVLALVIYPIAYLCFPSFRVSVKKRNDSTRNRAKLLAEEEAREAQVRAEATKWLEEHADDGA